MRFYLISDNSDALNGMRLSGIEGTIAHNREELQRALQAVLQEKDVGIILVTEKIADAYQAEVDSARKHSPETLLITIPSTGGTGAGTNRITRYLREAIGIKI